MSTITTRAGKGSPLTNTEVDSNFTNLNTDKYESGSNVALGSFSASSNTRGTLSTGSSSDILRVENTSGGWVLGYTSGLASIDLGASEALRIRASTTEYLRVKSGEAVFNDGGADIDFRVESDTNTHALFVDAGNNVVGLGTANTVDPWSGYTPTAIGNMLMVGSTGASSTFTNIVHGGYYDGTSWLQRFTDVTVARQELVGNASGATQNFYTATNVPADTAVAFKKNLTLAHNSSIFNEDGADIDFRVQSDSNTHMLFVDAGNNRVGIGTDSPYSGYALTVNGLIAQNGTAVTGIVYPYYAEMARTTASASTDQWIKIWDNNNSSGSPYTLHFKILTDGDNTVWQGEFTVTLAGYGFKHSISCDSNQYYNQEKLIEIATFNTGATTSLQVWVKLRSMTTSTGYLRVWCDQSQIVASASLAADTVPSYTSNSARLTFVHWNMASQSGKAVSKGIGFGTGSLAKFYRADESRKTHVGHDDNGFYIATQNTGDNLTLSVTQGSYDIIFGADGYEFTVNEGSADADFRVESNDNANMLFVDGANNRVGIGTGSPNTTLYVAGEISLNGAVSHAQTMVVPANSTRYLTVNITASYGMYEIMASAYGSSGSGNCFLHWTDGGHGGGDPYHRAHLISRNTQGNPVLGGLYKTAGGTYIKIQNTNTSYDLTFHVWVRGYNSSNVCPTFSMEEVEPTATSAVTALVVDDVNGRVGIGTNAPTNGLHLQDKSILNYYNFDSGYQSMLTQTSYDTTSSTSATLFVGATTVASSGPFGTPANSTYIVNDSSGRSAVNMWLGSYGSMLFGTSNGSERLRLGSTVVFNEQSYDQDFRVESDGNSNMLFVDAGNNRVGIGTGSPSAGSLNVVGNTAEAGTNTYYAAKFSAGSYSDTGSYTTMLGLGVENAPWSKGAIGFTRYDSYDVGYIGFYVNGDASGQSTTALSHERLRITPSDIVVNDTSSDVDFRVESDTNTHALFVDAGNSRVGVNTSSPITSFAVANQSLNANSLTTTTVRQSGMVLSGTNQDNITGNYISGVALGRVNEEFAAVLAYDAGGNAATGIAFIAGGTAGINEVAKITPDLYLRMASGTGGIQFNGDTAAANALNDYEEGTWSPYIRGTTAGSYTMGGVTAGKYTKVGNKVTATATIQWTGVTTAYSGNLAVYGLPYACSGVRCVGSMGAISYGLSFTSGYGQWVYLIDPSSAFVYIIQNSTTGAGYNHAPSVSSTGLVYSLTITYFTS